MAKRKSKHIPQVCGVKFTRNVYLCVIRVTMLFLYPIKDHTQNNPELLYSVRSVAKAYPDAEICIISKELPKWAVNMQHYYFKETGSRGAENVWRKLLAWSKNQKADFILMNDDIFINKPYAIQDRHFFDGTLVDRAKDLKPTNFYRMRIEATYSLVAGICPSTYCFDIHQPFHTTPDQILWLDQHFKMNERHYLFKSLLGNLGVLPSVKAVHCKLNSPDQINEGMLYFSCDDGFISKGGGAALDILWPEKSRFEK
jgi:hypothetical protein